MGLALLKQTEAQHKTIIVGLGKTGLSCACFLVRRGCLDQPVELREQRYLLAGRDLRANLAAAAPSVLRWSPTFEERPAACSVLLGAAPAASGPWRRHARRGGGPHPERSAGLRGKEQTGME